MIKMLKKNVIYNNEEKCYEASYVYNKDLQMLPSYEEEVLRMQMSLEKKLVGAKKADQFNLQVSEFFDRGVLEWVPEIELKTDQQCSYIPLTYTERENSSTALRVCGNSSFPCSNHPSFNTVQVPGPNVMSSLFRCILQFRSAHSVALGDISKMFHRVKTESKTNNLRRVWIKEGGMGSNTRWKTARFKQMSFGDILAPAFAIVILRMCIETFIVDQTLKIRLSESTYGTQAAGWINYL